MNLTPEEYAILTHELHKTLNELIERTQDNQPGPLFEEKTRYESLLKKLERSHRHPQPFITADIIIWRFTEEFRNYCDLPASLTVPIRHGKSNIEILMIQRGREPYLDHWAFPGGHFDIDTDESIRDAAFRELEEETGIQKRHLYGLNFDRYYDQKKRDTRGRYVTFVFSGELNPLDAPEVKAADDAKNVKWINKSDVLGEKLAFDHRTIFQNWSK